MSARMLARLVGALAVLALAIPAAAIAHPGVYQVVAKVAKTAARQTITVNATGGTFKPSAGATAVAFGATAAQVQSALQADPAYGYDNVAVTGPDGGPYAITFIGTLAGVRVAQLAPDASGLTGGARTAVASVDSAGGVNVTYGSDPTGATMAEQVQYVVASDGYAIGFKETNGVAGGGILNLKELPSAFRAAMTPAQKLASPLAQTGIQLHATCSGVAALSDPANILAFDLTGRTDGDPFFDYLPWQKTSAGLGDDQSHWIPVVKSATNGLPGAPAGGVDLSALSTVQDFTNACTALGGTYHPADTASNLTSAVVADAVNPLNTQIDGLNTQVGQLTAQIASLTADKTALADANARLTSENATLTAANKALSDGKRSLHLTLATRRLPLRQAIAMVTGTPRTKVVVRVEVSQAVATALHLTSRTIATARKTLDPQGAGLVSLTATKAARVALAHDAGSVPATVVASGGGSRASAPAQLP